MKFTPEEDEEIEYNFTLEYGEDKKSITLHCDLSNEITPYEYFELLKDYIIHMETLLNFKDSGTLN